MIGGSSSSSLGSATIETSGPATATWGAASEACAALRTSKFHSGPPTSTTVVTPLAIHTLKVAARRALLRATSLAYGTRSVGRVDAIVGPEEMHMAVDQTGDQPLAGTIDHLRSLGNRRGGTRTDLGDAGTFDHDRRVRTNRIGPVPVGVHDRGVHDCDHAWRGRTLLRGGVRAKETDCGKKRSTHQIHDRCLSPPSSPAGSCRTGPTTSSRSR